MCVCVCWYETYEQCILVHTLTLFITYSGPSHHAQCVCVWLCMCVCVHDIYMCIGGEVWEEDRKQTSE